MRSLCLSLCAVLVPCWAAAASEPGAIFGQKPDGVYEEHGRVDPCTLGVAKRGDPPRDEWAKIRKQLEDRNPAARLRALGEMLTAARPDRFEACVSESVRQIEVLRAAIAYLESHPDKGTDELTGYEELLEDFLRLEATARRLKARKEIEAEFAALGLSVDGVVCRQGRACSAVIGGVMVVEGSVLSPGARRGVEVLVRRVTPDSVICVYRGLEVELRL